MANWPRAKTVRTSSTFHAFTPTGPHRAIGTVGRNSREKHHFLGFWPTLWPSGGPRPVSSRPRHTRPTESATAKFQEPISKSHLPKSRLRDPQPKDQSSVMEFVFWFLVLDIWSLVLGSWYLVLYF